MVGKKTLTIKKEKGKNFGNNNPKMKAKIKVKKIFLESLNNTNPIEKNKPETSKTPNNNMK
jgi:hypothetical protein